MIEHQRHDDSVVIRVPATDTRAKMYEALRDLERERDYALNEAEWLREAISVARAELEPVVERAGVDPYEHARAALNALASTPAPSEERR